MGKAGKLEPSGGNTNETSSRLFKKSGHPTHLPLPDASSKSAQTAPASTRPVAHDRTTSSKRPGQDTGAGAPTSYTSRGAPQLPS